MRKKVKWDSFTNLQITLSHLDFKFTSQLSSCVVPLLWLALKVTWSRPSSFLLVGMASSLNTTPSGSKGATPSSSSLNRLSTASTEGKTEGSKLRNANPSQYVKLNVGGSLHYTTVGTLTKVSTSCRSLLKIGFL